MTFKISPAPHQRSKKSTLQIMIELTIGLGIVFLSAVITTFIKLGAEYGVKAILLMLIAVLTSFACDAVNTLLTNKLNKDILKKIPDAMFHNYSWVTGMILTLCCPVWASYYSIIISVIFANMIGKFVFGGFGKNIFNPAAVGFIFYKLCFDGFNSTPDLSAGLDVHTGATITNAINSQTQWLGDKAFSLNIGDILLGNYFGGMGETFTIVLIIVGIVLAIRRVINWRAPVFYLGTIAVTSLVMGLVLGFKDPMLYVVYHLATGGAMFAAVFMFTDPVTTPTSSYGNCLIGVIAAALTLLIRIATKNPEGVVYSIAVINLLTPMIDHCITGRSNDKLKLKYGVTFSTAVVTVALCTTVGFNLNGGKESYIKNGMSVDEYALAEETYSFAALENKEYEFYPYNLEISDANKEKFEYYTALELGENRYAYLSEAYYVCIDGSPVSVIYNIKENFTYNNGYSDRKASGYLNALMNIETGKFEDFKFDVPGNNTASYGAIAGNHFVNKNLLEDLSSLTEEDLKCGATFTANALKSALQTALDEFNYAKSQTDFGKLGGM